MHETVTESGHQFGKKDQTKRYNMHEDFFIFLKPLISADDRTLDVGSRVFAAICCAYVKPKSKCLSSVQVKQAGRQAMQTAARVWELSKCIM